MRQETQRSNARQPKAGHVITGLAAAGLFAFALFAVGVFAGCGGETGTPAAPTPAAAADSTAAETLQKTCPVMGGAIDKDYYVDYEGRRIYFCCASCIEEFKKDPEKYIGKVDEEIAKAKAALEESAYVAQTNRCPVTLCHGRSCPAVPAGAPRRPLTTGLLLLGAT